MTATEYGNREGYRRGEPRVIALPGELATAGLTYDFPGVELFRLESFAFVLTTSAGVANRQVVARALDSQGVAVYSNAAPAVQTAGLTVAYSFAPFTVAYGTAAAGFMGAAFLGGRLPGNMTIAVHVGAAQAGDLIHEARLLVCQYDYVQPRE